MKSAWVVVMGGLMCGACHDTTPTAGTDGGVEPSYAALTMSYRANDPKFVVTGDGTTLTAVGSKTLAALKSLTWDLAIGSGSTQVVISAGGSADVNGVTYQASVCNDLVTTLSGCSGDLSCWNSKATVPTGAKPFTCQKPMSASGDCTQVTAPAGVALMGVPGFLYVYQGGISTVKISQQDTNTMEINPSSMTNGDGVLLTRTGQVTDEYPQNAYDWRQSLSDTRAAVNAHGAWTYSETACTGSVTHTMCNVLADEFAKCVAALVDSASAVPCFDADTSVQAAIGSNPYQFAAVCQ
jgi:hypothetical protein